MDYTRNEDKLGVGNCPHYNIIRSVTVVNDDSSSGDDIEPVTVDEVKQYLRLGGWEGDGFDFDDQLISNMITSAREKIEQYTGRYMTARRIRVRFTNGAGEIELPGNPDYATIDYTSDSGSSMTWSKPYAPTGHNLVAEYDVTLDTTQALKEAIKQDVAYHYENRGDEDTGGLSKDALATIKPFLKSAFL